MKKFIFMFVTLWILCSCALADGIHSTDFSERYYVRLKILQDHANADFELKSTSHMNKIARENKVHIYAIDELIYHTDDSGTITKLSYDIDLSVHKQYCAIAGLWRDTTADELSILTGAFNEEFFTNYINNRISDIFAATKEHAYPIGDYVVYVDGMKFEFRLKSQYPIEWIQQ